MNLIQLVFLAAMVSYAIYRQTRVGPAGGAGRFKMALIYGGVGLVSLGVSGWVLPGDSGGWVVLAIGIALSAVVGVARGLLTRVWTDENGDVLRQGTWLTVSLFIAMIITKIAITVFAQLSGIQTGSSFAQILLVVAIMIAVQAEIVHRRGQRLTRGESTALPHAVRA
ncbi:hypothetical protein [Microbacterium sp. EST19A]|uniref:hypothetical protein n=1 Tax=Microbacterium sp. EST19A TaxID=2862681 RepID=UPI001CBB6928|nr:hypothetical protein [Microbacterium sp. EST19A]